MTSSVLGLSAVGATLATSAIAVRGIMRDVAQIGDAARNAGVTPEAFQEWGYVFGQFRVGQDVVADGFRELNLRADEFIVTGGGSAAEAFTRLGFTAADLSDRLKDPSALLLEIMRRLEGVDNASRIRIGDEIFGGTAGERFVSVVAQGADRLEELIGNARDFGLVVERDLIVRASILEEKFNTLTARAQAFFHTVAVGVFAGGIETPADMLERMFGSLERARAVLGDLGFDTLIAETRELSDSTEAALDGVSRLADGVDRDVTRVARSMADVTGQLSDLGMVDEMLSFDSVIADMEQLVSRFQAGEISAADFERELQTAVTRAGEALTALGEIDGVTTTDAQAQIAALQRALALARTEARGLASELPGDPYGMDTGAPLDGVPMLQDMQGGRRASAPPPAPRNIDFDLPPVQSGGGSGGSETGYAGTVADIRERTEALLAEAASLAQVAASGIQYADAIEYARERARLLTAAQAEGRAITPELTAEIDAMAAAYVTAGDNAEQAAERMRRVQEAGERGIGAVTDIFMAMAQGGEQGRRAVVSLILELARMQAMRGFQSLGASGGGSIFSIIGGLLGKNARGTKSWRGGPSIVGEEGPEILNLPVGAAITPALETASLLRSAGAAPSIVYNIDARGAQRGVAEEIAAQLDARTPALVQQAMLATKSAQMRGY
ncbi:phage tail tape measure protein [Pararhodobacter zhoushanensis]|uniref:Phage tail tape measure protein n=1 Tax=Pararhodobacter zhoushanensis TaxID=2479545 RepID=A0ABT3H3Z8_9RHOB|nr:phage tail tape measure protein [Pararhodobacter zhoushanensis]MCW1934536.1 phage tail tape measure protein [Pararhodobacter zhoushanensis]